MQIRIPRTTLFLLLITTIFSIFVAKVNSIPLAGGGGRGRGSSDFSEIEKRWAVGQSDQQILSTLNLRYLTPSFPITRTFEGPGSFAAATDSRSLAAAAAAEKERQQRRRNWMVRSRNFVGGLRFGWVVRVGRRERR